MTSLTDILKDQNMLRAQVEDLRVATGELPFVESVEVKVTTTNGKYMLPDSDTLRGKIILGVYNIAQTQNATPADTVFAKNSGRAVVSEDVLQSSYLTLVSDNLRFVDGLWLPQITIRNADRQVQRLRKVRGFNPTKSYIEVANPSTPAGKIVVGTSFQLVFLYL
jgi:hypothetical protein